MNSQIGMIYLIDVSGENNFGIFTRPGDNGCLLYTSDAADEVSPV